MEINLPRSYYHAFVILVVWKIIHTNCHDHFYVLDNFWTFKHQHRFNQDEQNCLYQSNHNSSRLYCINHPPSRTNRRVFHQRVIHQKRSNNSISLMGANPTNKNAKSEAWPDWELKVDERYKLTIIISDCIFMIM